MQDRDKLYIDGAWTPSTGSGTIDVINATTEEVMGRIPEGTAEDVDRAAKAARRAFETWSSTPVEERAKYLQRLHEGLNARMQEIAETVTGEVGMPMVFSQMIQAGLPAMVMGSYVDIVNQFPFEEQIGNSLVVREPLGVVGCITPWNYPLHQIVAKVAPAIGAGCTVVLKPSEVAPLNAFILAEIINDVGLPNGVFNLVSGTGPVVGEAIAAHPLVDMVSLTGSVRAGSRVMELASQSIKRVGLELGGKSANVILDDADVEKAVSVGIVDALRNGGQACGGLTRVLVPRPKLGIAEEAAASAAASFRLGDPLDPATTMGPMSNKGQRDRVRGYIRTGIDEGARLVVGGPGQPEGLDVGFYVKPTVFTGDNSMRIAREEIFGPVVVL